MKMKVREGNNQLALVWSMDKNTVDVVFPGQNSSVILTTKEFLDFLFVIAFFIIQLVTAVQPIENEGNTKETIN